MLKAFVKDSAMYAIPSFISRGVSLILIPFYTSVLSPADYGSMDLLAAFTNLINLTIALEVSQGVARFYGSERELDTKASYFSSALWFTIICYSVFLIFGFGFSDFLSPRIMGAKGLNNSFKIGLAAIWIGGISYLIQNQFRWEMRSKMYAIMSVVVLLVTFGVSFWLTYILKYGLNGMLVGQACGNLAGVLVGIYALKKGIRYKIDIAILKRMLMFSIPLVPSGIAVFVSTYVDRLMIAHFLNITDVGLFGMGLRLASIISLVMAGFQGAITPLIYSNYEKPDTPDQLARIYRMFLILALQAFLVLTLFAEEILKVVTSPSYYGAAVVVGYLVPAVLLSQMYIFAPGLALANKTKYFIWINLGGAIMNTVLNWLLIPLLGIVGAALATFINYIIVFTTYMYFSQKYYYVPHKWSRILVSALFVFAIAYVVPTFKFTKELTITFKIFGILSSIFFMYFCKMITKQEFAQVINYVSLRIKPK